MRNKHVKLQASEKQQLYIHFKFYTIYILF